MIALVAGPPSPNGPLPTRPAKVVIVPCADTRLTVPVAKSAMYILPLRSASTADGTERAALVAGPPSPENPLVPLPATVVIIPPDTLRTRWLPASGIYRLPAESRARFCGAGPVLVSDAAVAGPPSPEK